MAQPLKRGTRLHTPRPATGLTMVMIATRLHTLRPATGLTMAIAVPLTMDLIPSIIPPTTPTTLPKNAMTRTSRATIAMVAQPLTRDTRLHTQRPTTGLMMAIAVTLTMDPIPSTTPTTPTTMAKNAMTRTRLATIAMTPARITTTPTTSWKVALMDHLWQ